LGRASARGIVKAGAAKAGQQGPSEDEGEEFFTKEGQYSYFKQPPINNKYKELKCEVAHCK